MHFSTICPLVLFALEYYKKWPHALGGLCQPALSTQSPASQCPWCFNVWLSYNLVMDGFEGGDH